MENNSTSAPSALLPTIWPKHSFPITTTILTALGAILLAILPIALYRIYLVSAKIVPTDALISQVPVLHILISIAVSYVPLIVYLLLVVPRVAACSLADLGVHRPTMRQVVIGIAGAFAMFVVVIITSSVLTAITHEHQTETAVALLRKLKTPLDTLAFIAIAVIFAPMVEEFAFRVFLFNAISRHTSTKIGAIVSGIAFGIVHGPGLTITIPLAFGGVMLAWIYTKSGCYWSNVITHALFNSLGVMAVLVFHATD